MTRDSSIFSRGRKGQSAIEYLMTYGWMLLVVAIVGGAIFATVQGQCATQSSGFTGQAVQVNDFGVTPNNLQVEFRNGQDEEVNITQVVISDDSGSIATNTSIGQVLSVGDSATLTFPQLVQSEACNSYDLEVTFDKGGITGQVATGGLSGQMAPR